MTQVIGPYNPVAASPMVAKRCLVENYYRFVEKRRSEFDINNIPIFDEIEEIKKNFDNQRNEHESNGEALNGDDFDGNNEEEQTDNLKKSQKRKRSDSDVSSQPSVTKKRKLCDN
eukprot:TRINITY_DN9826_c0_g1_i1.p1 TRINITY_DN9826_c0_g1~~TRINITY_DN9826_c0_g1_i1.p1  ORF type:complete len:115 (+),score=38.39 TRINITY_DN9826_c0_g1_i1:87-431(+)